MKARLVGLITVSGLLLPALTGCLYLNRPLSVTVLDAETKQPIPDCKVDVNYRVMLDFARLFSVPVEKVDGRTNQEGKTKLFCDPFHPSSSIEIAAEGYIPARGGEFSFSNLKDQFLFSPYKRLAFHNQLTIYLQPRAKVQILCPEDYRGPVVLVSPVATQNSGPLGKQAFAFSLPPSKIITFPDSDLMDSFSTHGWIPIMDSFVPENGDKIFAEHLQAQYPSGKTFPAELSFLYGLKGDKNQIRFFRLRNFSKKFEESISIFVLGNYEEYQTWDQNLRSLEYNLDEKGYQKLMEIISSN